MVDLQWNPDQGIIKELRKMTEQLSKSSCLAVGTRTLSWNDVSKEVETGTDFGRRFYESFVETLRVLEQNE